jgi:hypothetical protein
LFLSFRSDANDKGDLIKHAVIRRECVGDVSTYFNHIGTDRSDEHVNYDNISSTKGSDVTSSCDSNNNNNDNINNNNNNDINNNNDNNNNNAHNNNNDNHNKNNNNNIYHFQHRIYNYYCGKLGPFTYLYEILQKISIILIKPGLSFQKYENILIEDRKGNKWKGKCEWLNGKVEIFKGVRENDIFNYDVNIDIWSYMKNEKVENDGKDKINDRYKYNSDRSSKSKGNDNVNEVDTDDSQYYKVDFITNFYTAIILFLSLKQYHSIQLKYLLYNHIHDDNNVVDDKDSNNYDNHHHYHIENQQNKESNFSKKFHEIGLNDKKSVFDFHHTIVEGIIMLENRIKLLLKPKNSLWEEIIFDSSTRWDEILFTKNSYSNRVQFSTSSSDNGNRINDYAYYHHHQQQQHNDDVVNNNNSIKAIDRMTVLKQLNNDNTYHKYNIYLAEKLFHIIAIYIHHRSKINSSSSSTSSSSTVSTTSGILHNLHIPTMSGNAGNCGNSSISFIKFIGCGNCQGSGIHDYYLRSDECIEITECKEVLHLWRHLCIKHENMKTEMKLMELHTNRHHSSTTSSTSSSSTSSSSPSSVSHQQSQSLNHLHSTAPISSDDIDTSIIGFHTRITLSTLSREVSRRSWVKIID